jgi:NAD(P)-dependent dehydrogenase (short-subunit alcohol dehydrogenase family)/rhamnose utilization protein RhaD (predicted bifunctional aldolase and dehydrogenase)
MKPEIRDLIEISRYYGNLKEYVIAGGGNTSFKDNDTIWIKASGEPLSGLSEEGLVPLDRHRLDLISRSKYSDDPVAREEEVKNDLFRCIRDSKLSGRPSVETSLHNLIRYKFVIHLHPTLVNGLLCGRNSATLTGRLFGKKVLYIPYTDPGYTLFKSLESEIMLYRKKFQNDPQIIFLENHGSFVAADSIREIRHIYENLISTIAGHIRPLPAPEQLSYDPLLNDVLPVIRMLMSTKEPPIIRHRNNSLIASYYESRQEFHKISLPLTPDMIVYCKARYLYIEQSATAEKILESFRLQLPRFEDEYGYPPKVIIIKNMGVFAVAESAASAETVLDVYEDLVKIVHYSSECGGTRYLTPEQVAFIDQWEAENYRRKLSHSGSRDNKMSQRIAIVTGGARGFGAGIAEELCKRNMNVVIADIDEEEGKRIVLELGSVKSSGRLLFVKTDVSDPVSVKNLVMNAVSEFGGLDIMISNAGILRAGGLDELDPETFSLTTSINYNGYFHCAKYASEIMRIQNREKPDYYTDIIQINSKSGLRGSNRNFAYAGSKFGSIGLTQSFALELAPYRIKVNAICPGNYYEGPLWSDPKKGLFVQYLRTGKVPGAKSIEDVRKFYEDQVPMKRGCRLDDVVRALLYVIEQEYETGQAVPVTGGQVMLG